MDKKQLKNEVLELDYSLGGLLCNIESLKAIDTEMGHISEDVDNTNKTDITEMGIQFRNISHKITLINDLLHYTLEDAIKNYEKCQHIKTGLFLEFIEEENTPNSENQG